MRNVTGDFTATVIRQRPVGQAPQFERCHDIQPCLAASAIVGASVRPHSLERERPDLPCQYCLRDSYDKRLGLCSSLACVPTRMKQSRTCDVREQAELLELLAGSLRRLSADSPAHAVQLTGNLTFSCLGRPPLSEAGRHCVRF